MIKPLTENIDKINMIPIIKLINEKIKLFFLNKNKNNLININGCWGSGKSTIINNLEHFYDPNDNLQWIIINLWEYETTDGPYYNILQDILTKIIPVNKSVDSNEKKQVEKFSKIKCLLKKIKVGIAITDPNTGFIYDPYVKAELNNSTNLNTEESKDLRTIIDEASNEIKEIIKSSKKNIIIVFDELDRCTPDNQIKFLSYIKNIFLKITNVFYLVASNNEFVNLSINKGLIENTNEFINEKYTDKIFNVTINLKDIFFVENMIFSNNHYIQQFIKKEKITNPRLINKILFQVKNLINNLKNYENFSFLTDKTNLSWKEMTLKRLEFIIFYIKYIKYKNYLDYNYLLKLTNVNSIEWEKLLTDLKTKVININGIAAKLEIKDKVLFEWILWNKKFVFPNSNYSPSSPKRYHSSYFYIEVDNKIFPIWFAALLPFLGSYFGNTNLIKEFRFFKEASNKNVDFSLKYELQNRDNKDYKDVYNNVLNSFIVLDTTKLDIPSYLKAFISILLKDFDVQNYIVEEFKITFDVIKQITQESIFDY